VPTSARTGARRGNRPGRCRSLGVASADRYRGGVHTRARTWIGVTLAVVPAAALANYLVSVGLDRADKIASVAGLLVSGAGLVIAVLGHRAGRRDRARAAADIEAPKVHNEIRGSDVSGPVVQARDITAALTFGPPRDTDGESARG
jgi:hypothetical protein